ncbi:hypothetical protein C1H46_008516 [Malus baccata]|uniref:NOA1/YqeH-like C-terminal domain-containing protein n=1 Tax=Malus baccata TaxID=106549 RepID=A0A540N5K4_MALBA|nr:hypothetical protein C1H46_008516 [Malus baccata]
MKEGLNEIVLKIGDQEEEGSVDEIEGSLKKMNWKWGMRVGYGNIKEETIERMKKKKVPKLEKKRMPREAHKEKEEVTVCARCHSLRNYGQERLPKLVLVATKVDLLRSQVSPARLDRWVRHRDKAGGGPKLSGVYMGSKCGPVHSHKCTCKERRSKGHKAHGSSSSWDNIGGILSAKAVLFDTPGLLHPYLVSMRLDLIWQTIHVGGLARLDLVQASVETIYLTVWASPNISLHMEKIENADETWRKHGGIRLQPPIGADRAAEMRKREERGIKVSGASWDVNSIDIAVAGLGWFSLGLKGEATLALWT